MTTDVMTFESISLEDLFPEGVPEQRTLTDEELETLQPVGILFDKIDTVMAEMPEQQEEDATRAVLLASVESLRSIYGEVLSSGHITRSDALTIKNLIVSTESADTFFDRHPVNSYTEMGSLVNYQVTCENLVVNILKGIGKLIMAIFGAFVGVVKAILRALFGVGKQLDEAKRADPVVTRAYDAAKQKGAENQYTPKASGVSHDWDRHAAMTVFEEVVFFNRPFPGGTLAINETAKLFQSVVPRLIQYSASLHAEFFDLLAGKQPNPTPFIVDADLEKLTFSGFNPGELLCRGDEYYAPSRSASVQSQALVLCAALNSHVFKNAVVHANTMPSAERLSVESIDNLRTYVTNHKAETFKSVVDSAAMLSDKQSTLSKAMLKVSGDLINNKVSVEQSKANRMLDLSEEMSRLVSLSGRASEFVASWAAVRGAFSAKFWLFTKGYVK